MMQNGPYLLNATIRDGSWSAEFIAEDDKTPTLCVTVAGRALDGLQIVRGKEQRHWALSFAIPPQAINEGLQTFFVGPPAGVPIGSFTLLAGDLPPQDAMTELRQLRNELDVVKRALRNLNK